MKFPYDIISIAYRLASSAMKVYGKTVAYKIIDGETARSVTRIAGYCMTAVENFRTTIELGLENNRK